MHTPDQDDTELEQMARQLAGEASQAERVEFGRRLTDPAVRERFEAATADWEAAALAGPVSVDRAWSALRARLDREISESTSTMRFASKGRWWLGNVGLLRVAAAALLIATTGLVWKRTRGSGEAADTASAASSVLATTKVAERSQIRLPDGTEVQLGAASSLRTLAGYGEGAREVELVGEAVFHVTHDESRPFRVRTASTVIEDLGTAFVVRALMREPVRVAVSEGSVSVGRIGTPRDRHVVLQPRDVAVVNDTGDAVVSRGVDVERFSAWTTGELAFNDETLRSAIIELERWYDVEFNVTDAVLLRRPLNVTFAGQSIDEVLGVIGRMLDVKFERDGRAIRVSAPVRTGLVPSLAPQVGGGA